MSSRDYVWVDDFDAFFGWQWQEVSHRGRTRYQKVRSGPDSERALRAVSQASASELVRKVQVDLAEFPILVWSWKVMNVIEQPPRPGRDGLDFPARVILHFAPDAQSVERKIDYVWASEGRAGVPLPVAGGQGKEAVLPIQAGRGELDIWVGEARNVREDHLALFGVEPASLRALSIMTDTDDTGTQATAFYDDLRFVRGTDRSILPIETSSPEPAADR